MNTPQSPFLSYGLSLLWILCLSLGAGRWVSRGFPVKKSLLGPSPPSTLGASFFTETFTASFLGLLGFGVIGGILNFFVPLRPIAPVVCGLIAVSGWWSAFRREPKLWSLALLAAAAVGALLAVSTVASLELHNARHSDLGLYHLPYLRWIQNERLPLGLGLLHGRFAFDSLWHLLAGAVSWGPLADAISASLLPALASLFFCAFAASSLELRDPGRRGPSNFFALTFLVFFCCQHFTRVALFFNSGALHMDAAAMFTLAFALKLFLELSFDRLILALILGVWIKASLLAYLGIALPVLVLKKRIGRAALMTTLLIGLAWVIRNFMLSGCLIYPLAQTCFRGVSFGVGPLGAVRESEEIKAWARFLGAPVADTNHDFAWVPYWIAKLKLDAMNLRLILFLVLGLVAWVAFFAMSPSAGRSVKSQRLGALALVMLLIGLASWFFTAPDPRFAWGTLFCLGTLPIAMALFSWKTRFSRLIPSLSLLAIAALFWLGAKSYDLTSWAPSDVFHREWPHFSHPWTSFEEFPLAQDTTRSGLKVWHPTYLDGCWDGPRPCAPSVRQDLDGMERGGRWWFSTESAASTAAPPERTQSGASGLESKTP